MTDWTDPNITRTLEVALYHQGKAFAEPSRQIISPGKAFAYSLPLFEFGGSSALPGELRITSDGATTEDYVSVLLWLLDPYRNVMGSYRPGLWYLEKSDVPTTVIFDNPPHERYWPGGRYVLTLRTAA